MRGTIKQAFKSWIYGGISIIFDFGIFWLLNHFLLTSLKTIPFNVGPFRYGIEDVVNKELEGQTYDKERLEIVNTTEIIQMAEPPVMAIRKKKDF